MDMSTGGEFHDKLSEFCETYTNLGLFIFIKKLFSKSLYVYICLLGVCLFLVAKQFAKLFLSLFISLYIGSVIN